MHILDNTGIIMSYDFYFFISKFNLNDRKQYSNIVKAIPQCIIQMSCNLFQSNAIPYFPKFLVNVLALTNIHLSNTTIQKAFVKEL